MRYGIVTPVIIANPRVVNVWEHAADVDALAAIARAADRLGYHHLTASNHVAIPHAAAPRRGRRYWDPAVTLGYVAAITARVRLATYVLVLGYHHPLEIVKRYGTLDLVSRGRLILGVGVGSLQEEFAMLGRDFARRGAMAHEAIRAIRASFGQREPTFHGEFYDFAGVTIDPVSVQAHVPIWIGGRTARSLRRAIELDCDAWVPFALEPEEVRTLLARARESAALGEHDQVRSRSGCRPSRRSIRSASRSACATRSRATRPAARPCSTCASGAARSSTTSSRWRPSSTWPGPSRERPPRAARGDVTQRCDSRASSGFA